MIDEFGDGMEPAKGLQDSRKKTESNSKTHITDESNSFDLDNSDDLNRFIQKYETMLDGEGYAKKNGPQSQKPNGNNQGQPGGPNPLSKDRSRELEDSWGSLQIQAEQMLAGGGEIVDESPVPSDADSVKKKSVMSGSTAAANVSHNVTEEEIIAEEIRLANEKQSSGAKR